MILGGHGSRKVSVLGNEIRDVGVHEVTFHASGLSSGVYFYRIEAGSFLQARKRGLLRRNVTLNEAKGRLGDSRVFSVLCTRPQDENRESDRPHILILSRNRIGFLHDGHSLL
jgi:hypothetical protein